MRHRYLLISSRLKIALILGALVLPTSALLRAQLPLGADVVLANVKARNEARKETARKLLAKDAITVVLVGTGSPLPSDRAQASTAVFVDGRFLLFDCGDGASRSIDALNLPIGQIEAVFLTHFHSDHFADLGEIIDRSWIQGRRQVLAVYGPSGVAEVLDGFQRAYRLERGYRTAHHGEKVMPSEFAGAAAKPFAPDESGESVTVYDQQGVVVKAFAVNHAPVHPAVGYRVEFGGKVVVISGDTTATASLATQSRDADLLVAEAMKMATVSQMQKANEQLGNDAIAHILHDIQSYHIDVEQLGALAEEAKVKRLALTHLVPPVPKAVAPLLFKRPVSEKYHGETVVGEDGTRLVIPLP